MARSPVTTGTPLDRQTSDVVARLATCWALTPEQAARHICGNQQRFLGATGLPQ
ncbi:hypothetical protein [Streptomyces dangxiongensis]|uniref:hypothetical protein n=1 Tax=Streptomyces dangxiongensis TaxID=1442032 RepID=UPI0013CE819E|nr:hypothetical protein [Streptomyces dangxiongensis]